MNVASFVQEYEGIFPLDLVTKEQYVKINAKLLKERKVSISVENPRLEGGRVTQIKLRLFMVVDEDGYLLPQQAGGTGIVVPGFRTGALSVDDLLENGLLCPEQTAEQVREILFRDFELHWSEGKDPYGKDAKGRTYLTAYDDTSEVIFSISERINPTTGDPVVGIDEIGLYNLKVGVTGPTSKVINLKSKLRK